MHKGYKGLNGLDGFDINISLTTDHGSVRVGITDVIVAADMNNDDYIDIIVGNNGGSIQIFMNLGDSTYATGASVFTIPDNCDDILTTHAIAAVCRVGIN